MGGSPAWMRASTTEAFPALAAHMSRSMLSVPADGLLTKVCICSARCAALEARSTTTCSSMAAGSSRESCNFCRTSPRMPSYLRRHPYTSQSSLPQHHHSVRAVVSFHHCSREPRLSTFAPICSSRPRQAQCIAGACYHLYTQRACVCVVSHGDSPIHHSSEERLVELALIQHTVQQIHRLYPVPPAWQSQQSAPAQLLELCEDLTHTLPKSRFRQGVDHSQRDGNTRDTFTLPILCMKPDVPSVTAPPSAYRLASVAVAASLFQTASQLGSQMRDRHGEQATTITLDIYAECLLTRS